ncbi:LysR family transcriptional regulator [Epidermidibacterium keratini]|uniref:LysR family transcriptional regulator n=1 Tax=Epidermidibacterium keratini TaxID=1891644 RepID=A0A7L4YPU2_9ACTN|nr:LysR family transcriptional regulator [Epidermidibacterium keratini]QHC00577.1 LysR family transcriptional regulator [Epidermidibacterium keratini]
MTTSRIERRHLAAIAALRGDGGFARAAERLFVTPSTLAATLRQLERMIGSRLVERTSGGMRLNARGREVAETAAEALRAMDGVLQDARRSSMSESGSLFVQMTPMLAEGLGADLLASLMAARPQLRLAVRALRRPIVANVALAVAAGEVDVGLTEHLVRPPDGLVHVPLGTVEMAYVFPAATGIRPRRTTLKHLEQFGLIVAPYFESSDVYAELRTRSSTIDTVVRARVAERPAFVELALGGIGGFLSEFPPRAELTELGLHVARFAEPIIRRFATVARADDRRTMITDVLAASEQLAQSTVRRRSGDDASL